MTFEEGLFTVSEQEMQEKEIISVADEEETEMPIEVNPQLRYPAPIAGPEWGTPVERLPVQEEKVEKAEQSAEDTNWRNSGDPKHFANFLAREMSRLPRSSQVRGNRSAMERLLGQYKSLDTHISKALRSDYDGVLDTKYIDGTRRSIDQNIQDLEDGLFSIDELKRNNRKLRHRRGETSPEITKEATAPHFNGMQIHITAFERAIVGALINGKVAGGRNMEELYDKAKKMYKLNDREELSVLQILADFGYPVYRDRLRLTDDSVDPSTTEGHGEWSSTYMA